MGAGNSLMLSDGRRSLKTSDVESSLSAGHSIYSAVTTKQNPMVKKTFPRSIPQLLDKRGQP